MTTRTDTPDTIRAVLAELEQIEARAIAQRNELQSTSSIAEGNATPELLTQITRLDLQIKAIPDRRAKLGKDLQEAEARAETERAAKRLKDLETALADLDAAERRAEKNAAVLLRDLAAMRTLQDKINALAPENVTLQGPIAVPRAAAGFRERVLTLLEGAVPLLSLARLADKLPRQGPMKLITAALSARFDPEATRLILALDQSRHTERRWFIRDASWQEGLAASWRALQRLPRTMPTPFGYVRPEIYGQQLDAHLRRELASRGLNPQERAEEIAVQQQAINELLAARLQEDGNLDGRGALWPR